MKRLTSLLAALFLLLASTTWSQQLGKRITNKDVIDMTAVGLSDDVIIAKIRGAAAGGTLQFDTSVDGLKELKAAKVSDDPSRCPDPGRRRYTHLERPPPPAPGGPRLLEELQRLRPDRGTGNQPD